MRLQLGEAKYVRSLDYASEPWYFALNEKESNTGTDSPIYQELKTIPELNKLFSLAFQWRTQDGEAILARKWLSLLLKTKPSLADFEEIFLAQNELAEYCLKEDRTDLAKIVFDSFETIQQSDWFQQALQKESRDEQQEFMKFYQSRKKDFNELVQKVSDHSIEKEEINFYSNGYHEDQLYHKGVRLADQIDDLYEHTENLKELTEMVQKLDQIALRLINEYPLSSMIDDYLHLFYVSRYYLGLIEIDSGSAKKALEYLQEAEKALNRCQEEMYQDEAADLQIHQGYLSMAKAMAYGLQRDQKNFHSFLQQARSQLKEPDLDLEEKYQPDRK